MSMEERGVIAHGEDRSAAQPKRLPAWTRPALRRISASDAELGPLTPSVDGSFSKS